ncbi:MAG: 50S ribosomal protein L30 [Bacteroidetes bacterium]|nr:50S ribosomal protein L30 [Bacteroidota bacterium]MBL0051093.1 50S ribosomal protein L30 [Bacteroidota bacterium]
MVNKSSLVDKMATIKITQIKSGIDRPVRQKRNLIALGFTRNGQSIEKEATPQVLGMIRQVSHLLKVETV